MLRRLFLPVERRWRSRGHGVHSPFAYRFITSTLHNRCAYYSYGDIAEEAPTRRDAVIAERLFRIILSFRPRAVARYGATTPCVEEAIAAATAGYRVASETGFSIVTSATALDMPHLSDVTVFLNMWNADMQRLFERLESGLEYGMTFVGRDMAVAVNLPTLPRQRFNVNI